MKKILIKCKVTLERCQEAIGKRRKLVKVTLAGFVIAGFVFGSWYLATTMFFPYALAGEGTAINPELKGAKPKDAGAPAVQAQNNVSQVPQQETNPQNIQQEEVAPPAEELLTYEEAKAEKEARYAIKVSTKEGTQRIQNQPKIQSKTFFSYSPTSVYKIYCHEGYLTDIQLQPGEDIEFIGGGDTVRWIVDKALSGKGESRRWHVYVKPLKSGIQTNFIITTDKRAYQISARSTADFYVPIVGWNYPHDDKVAFVRQKDERLRKDDDQTVAVVAPDKFNFRYKIEEKTSWAFGGETYSWTPKMVFDDGKKTYIQMGDKMATTEAPALFMRNKEGLALVNYRVKGNYYIVDRLINQWAEMRNGKEIVMITRQK